MNLLDKPSLTLFHMQQIARVTANEVRTTNQRNEQKINDFKHVKEVVLFFVDSLVIKAKYEKNDAPYSIVALKISAAPWTNEKNDKTIDCKIKLKLELIFDTVKSENVWESSLFSIELIPESFTLSNKLLPEKNLLISSAIKFNELTNLIKIGIKEIGISYPPNEDE
jgi:hypothetical protein